jgi:deoxyribonuclease-4
VVGGVLGYEELCCRIFVFTKLLECYMPLLGAHMSAAGGAFKAVEAAARCGMDVVQLFTKNNNRWVAKDLTEADCEAFQTTLAEKGVAHPLSHSSYLINLGSPNDELWEKSIAAAVVELERATALGIPWVVLHPGAYTTSTEEEGLARIAAGLNQVHQRVPEGGGNFLLETMAGQGTTLGHRFEHLAEILEQVHEEQRLGVCIDTCHLFAAGYELRTKAKYNATIKELDNVIGLERVKAAHLNDSKAEFGACVDRHQHIGQGEIGLDGFTFLLRDTRFEHVPMYLETPKGNDGTDKLDLMNMQTLRECAGR